MTCLLAQTWQWRKWKCSAKVCAINHWTGSQKEMKDLLRDSLVAIDQKVDIEEIIWYLTDACLV